jgi:hypothetical protein
VISIVGSRPVAPSDISIAPSARECTPDGSEFTLRTVARQRFDTGLGERMPQTPRWETAVLLAV